MAPIIVHVVEDHTVLYTAGGALLGVAIGGGLAWLQQKSKVGADRAQLKERLVAEETRLDKQLAHDRELNELEALRKVLDEGGEALAHGSLTASRSANLWRQALSYDDPSKEDAEAKQRETAALAYSVHNRLGLRLPVGELVLGRYLEAAESLNDISVFLTNNAKQDDYAEHEQVFGELVAELDSCILNFLLPAQQRYGPKLEVPSTPVPREE